MSNLSVYEVIEGLTDWLGDGVNAIYEEGMIDGEPVDFISFDDDDSTPNINGYRIIVETTDGLKPHWMPTEIGCYQIVVRQGGPYKMDSENGL